MSTRTWLITVKVTADPDTFRDGELATDPQQLLSAIRDEIVSNLEECDAAAEIVQVIP